MPMRNRDPYNILLVVLNSSYQTILFLKGPQWKCSYTVLLCYRCRRTLYRVYSDSCREFSFNNVNLGESNVAQIFELIFGDSER